MINFCMMVCVFLLMMNLSLAWSSEAANGPKSLKLDAAARAKIPQQIIDKLERDDETFDVIILLKGYEGYVGKIKADKPQEMKQQQEGIRNKQNLVLNRINKPDLTLRHQFDNILGFSARVNARALKALAAMSDVELIEEDLEVETHLAQGIPLMEGSQARSVYDGSGVSIAIVDTGIDYLHPRLGGASFPNSKVIGGYDFGDNDTNPMDCNGHGTSVAGISAGDISTGPGDYTGGVAPKAKLYALKIVAGCIGSSYSSTIANAWSWAVTHKNDDPANPILVINTSFGGGYYTSACDATQTAVVLACIHAVANGITLFTSSGNNGYANAISAPACVSNSLSVGAVYDANIGYRSWAPCTDYETAPDQVTCYSNSANFLDILAPSNDAYTTAVGVSYTTNFGGTSAASPYAAGAAGVLQSFAKAAYGQFYTPDTLKTKLVSTGVPVNDSKNGITKPRVNLASIQPVGAMFDFSYYNSSGGVTEILIPIIPDGTWRQVTFTIPVAQHSTLYNKYLHVRGMTADFDGARLIGSIDSLQIGATTSSFETGTDGWSLLDCTRASGGAQHGSWKISYSLEAYGEDDWLEDYVFHIYRYNTSLSVGMPVSFWYNVITAD